MAIPVIMPKLGQSVETCIITKWYKKPGDTVEAGEPLFAFETDKAWFDEEAKVSGVLLAVFFEEDEEVPVLSNIGVIGEPGEAIDQYFPKKSDSAVKKVPAAGDGTTEPETEEMKTAITADDTGIIISPRALALARKRGIDFRRARPTGPGGRIIERDIDALYADDVLATKAAGEILAERRIPVETSGSGLGGRITLKDIQDADAHTAEMEVVLQNNVRRIIAHAMKQSLANTAQLTLHTSFDATAILAFRKQMKDGASKPEAKVASITAIIVYAVSRVLFGHPALNAHVYEDRLHIYKNAHLGIAVDTPRGLMVPTLFDANLKPLSEIAAETAALAEACRTGTINPDILRGATFTITNLGAFGIEMFTPILNPPQAGILGVNAIIERTRERDGKVSVFPAMGLSLTFDHRAIDGAPAARFLQELCSVLEAFGMHDKSKEEFLHDL